MADVFKAGMCTVNNECRTTVLDTEFCSSHVKCNTEEWNTKSKIYFIFILLKNGKLKHITILFQYMHLSLMMSVWLGRNITATSISVCYYLTLRLKIKFLKISKN